MAQISDWLSDFIRRLRRRRRVVLPAWAEIVRAKAGLPRSAAERGN